MNTRRWILAVVAVTTLVGCDRSSNDATDSVPPDPVGEDRVLRGVDVGGSETDIFLPDGSDSGGAAAPVVILLHGTSGDRSRMEPLATAVAASGALAYAPSWPVIDQVAPFPEDQGDEPYRRQSEAIVCILRSVKKTAAEFGGDPDDVTVVGHSGGGSSGWPATTRVRTNMQRNVRISTARTTCSPSTRRIATSTCGC